MVDLVKMLKVQKLIWISKIFYNNDYQWKETMKCILNVTELKLFFLSNCLKPVNITEFYVDFNDLIIEYDIDKKFYLFYLGMIKCIPRTWKKYCKGPIDWQCRRAMLGIDRREQNYFF